LGEEYRSFSSSLCNLLHSPFTSSCRHVAAVFLHLLFQQTTASNVSHAC
jgi:hypothetical protein